jgi:dienelactone hydrolase
MSDLTKLDYADGDIGLTGWIAQPSARPKAAVVVFPTIANVTPAAERRAKMLADAGFLAMIADFYGVPVDGFEQAGNLAKQLRADVDVYRGRLLAAVEALRSHPAASGLPMAVIGYCMGGQAALEVARSDAGIAAAVSFHGLLDTQRPAAGYPPLTARILVCHGDADPMVPRSQVLAFWEEMDAAGANWHFHSYSGVKHGFTDPGSDTRGIPAIAYDSSADRQSWAAMMELFSEIFG